MPRIFFSVLQLALIAGIILVGYSIVQKAQTVRNDASLEPVPAIQTKPGPKRQDKPKPFSHYSIIAQRDLFRTPKGNAPDKAAIDIEALKPTELKLKLWGTITGEDGMTRAVIEDQTTRRQAFYRVGDDVTTAKVKMILREKVILAVKGEDQILEIEKPSGSSKTTSAVRSAPGAPRQSVARPARARSQARQASNKPLTRRTVRLKLSRLGPISENPEDWNNYGTVVPYESDDGDSGLMFNRITPSSPLRRLGIRNGDIILDIDDEPVSELSDIVESLADLSAGEEMSLKIKRRGRERTLDFKFE